jgi:hypothetical protein
MLQQKTNASFGVIAAKAAIQISHSISALAKREAKRVLDSGSR